MQVASVKNLGADELRRKMTKLKWVDVLCNFNRAACIKTNSTEMKINGASISPSSRENNIFGVTLSVEKLN
jgi:hypothetical protein